MKKNRKLDTLLTQSLSSTIFYVPAKPHRHINWEITFFVEGNAINNINGKTYQAGVGTVFFCGKNDTHSIENKFSFKHKHIDIYFSDETMREICKSNFSDKLYDYFCDTTQQKQIFMPYQTFLALTERITIINITNEMTYDKQIYYPLITFVLSFYVEKIVYQQEEIDNWLAIYLAKIQKPDIFCQKVSEIVKLSNYSYSHFCMLFKKKMNINFSQYIINLRLNYAKDLLKTTSFSILKISEMLGYDSLSYFINIFKTHTGLSPLKFRAQSTKQTN